MNGGGAAKQVALGALCGLAWAAGFRAWMSEVSGISSHVDWWGTFGAVLLPGVIVGGLLGWAESIRRSGGRRGWRWLAASPLVFAIAPLLLPGAIEALFTEGLGGGATAVSLAAILGGFAASGRGRLWARILCGVISTVLIAGVTSITFFIAGPLLAATQPRGIWVALIAASFLVLFALTASIPFRSVVTEELLPRR